jgi:linalool dehydratase/isomerase-like protein
MSFLDPLKRIVKAISTRKNINKINEDKIMARESQASSKPPLSKATVTADQEGLRSVSGYPALSKESAGALKYLWRKCHVEDDWTKGGSLSDAWDRSSGWPYIAKPTYDMYSVGRNLARIAYEIPAWRDVIGESIKLLAGRWPQYMGWMDWVEQPGLDPKCNQYPYFYYQHMMPPGTAGWFNAPGYAGNGLSTQLEDIFATLCLGPKTKSRPTHPYYPSYHAVGREFEYDPVWGNGSGNVHFRSYWSEVIMHGRHITNDKWFDQEFEIVYDEETPKFNYDVKAMCKTLQDQHNTPFDPNGSSLHYGLDCEIGKTFPICVAVGGLAMHLCDQIHDTEYRSAYDKWQEWARQNVAGPDPDGPYEYCVPYIARDLNYFMTEPAVQMNFFYLWLAIHQLVFDEDWSRKLYDSCLKNYGKWEDDGTFHLNVPYEVSKPMVLDDPIGNGAALALAHYFNDEKHLGPLLEWHKTRYQPTYKDGEFYYLYGLEEDWPRGLPNGYGLLGHYGTPGDKGMARMYNELNLKKFEQPTVVDLDFPEVNVRQAIYDEDKDWLVFSIMPCIGKPGSSTSFRVTNLSDGEHEVYMDGQPFKNWEAKEASGEIIVTTTVDHHSFVIR